MRTKLPREKGYSQFWWVILLLVIAVVLPTVCLLWFMTQAVKNERLAVRQKLVDAYYSPLEEISQAVDETFNSEISPFKKAREITPGRLFQDVTTQVRANRGPCGVDGALIYDRKGNLIYPTITLDTPEQKPPLPAEIEQAGHLEFVEKDYALAAEAYRDILRKIGNRKPYSRVYATLGLGRCLVQLGDNDGAAEAFDEIDFAVRRCPAEVRNSPNMQRLRLQSNLAVFKLRKWDNHKLNAAIANALDRSRDFRNIPSDLRVFYGQKVLELFGHIDPSGKWNEALRLKRLISCEKLSLELAEKYSDVLYVSHLPDDQRWHRLPESRRLYGMRFETEDYLILLLKTEQGLTEDLYPYREKLGALKLDFRITDETNYYVCGIYKPKVKSLLTTSVSGYLPGWKLKLYINDPDFYTNAARKQVAIYTWTGILVIVLILAAGGLAGQAVGRQIKLNKLKNDFIATVSHELKTPLSSMRVLVDTLLEGHYKDQAQVTEYLQLVAKENKRLTGLIDNFLTFSRMERNKKAFDMLETSPAAIAKDAAEAVRTQFSKGRCAFEISIDENLPEVLADHDAMVTVLVNLLDNAYKYSYDDKKIELKVFAEDTSVCFQVSDNGVGLTRRAAKKIFNRFYQVDQSLSRAAGGTGLGLSIIKFIVDAHKGTIAVDSKPGKGSSFTVKLPAANQD